MTGTLAAKCAQPDCFYPESGCDLGHAPGTCPVWSGGEAEAGGAAPGECENLLMPWSGSALGLADVPFVAARTRPTVVGIVGPHNAGKTTLLGAWYLLLSRGQATGAGRRFAGSFTLAGWEAIAASLRWAPGQRPGFPPHTSSRAGRAPGLLHLAFKPDGGGAERSYLFTDAPGEWFQRWAANREAPEALGARWVADHADMFLFTADREALAGEDCGLTRGMLQRLAARLSAERANRPVALVWTKADVDVNATLEDDVRNAVMRPIPDAAEFHVSIESDLEGAGTGRGLIALLRWALDARRRAVNLPPPAARGGDPLFLVGAR